MQAGLVSPSDHSIGNSKSTGVSSGSLQRVGFGQGAFKQPAKSGQAEDEPQRQPREVTKQATTEPEAVVSGREELASDIAESGDVSFRQKRAIFSSSSRGSECSDAEAKKSSTGKASNRSDKAGSKSAAFRARAGNRP